MKLTVFINELNERVVEERVPTLIQAKDLESV